MNRFMHRYVYQDEQGDGTGGGAGGSGGGPLLSRAKNCAAAAFVRNSCCFPGVRSSQRCNRSAIS